MDTVIWGCTTADCSHSSILVSTEWVYMKQTNAGWCESVFSLLYYFVACKWYQPYNSFVCTVILHWVGIVFHIHLTQVCLRTTFTSNSRILILKLWVVYFDYKSLDSSVNINACPPHRFHWLKIGQCSTTPSSTTLATRKTISSSPTSPTSLWPSTSCLRLLPSHRYDTHTPALRLDV